MSLESIVDEPVSGLRSVEENSLRRQSMRLPVQADPSAVLERIKTNKRLSCSASRPMSNPPRVRILARWNDAEFFPRRRSEKTVGRGQVLLWTTTADKKLGAIGPRSRAYVLAMRRGRQSRSLARQVSAHTKF